MSHGSEMVVRFGQDERYLRLVEEVYGFKKIGDKDFPFSLAGNRLVSSAFFEYGGITVKGWGKKAIKTKCEQLLKETGAKYIEVHGGGAERGVFRDQKLYQSAVKAMPKTQRELWKGISYGAQKAVRQAEGFEVICREASPKEVRTVFYPLYCRWMKEFGSPVHPLKYFTLLKKYFGDDCRVVFAERRGEVLACLLGVVKGKIINLLSSPATKEAKKYRANDATHWFLLREMVDKKLSWFDFGPVRYEGQRRFKAKWGVEMLTYSYWYYPLTTQPAHLDPDGVWFKSLRFIWKNLIPSSVTNLTGPAIRKWLVV